MSESVVVALISLVGTLGGTFGGILVSNKLTNYRIEQLEKKVDKHNQVIERVYALEKELEVFQPLTVKDEAFESYIKEKNG